jgi:hypothetical protein
LTGLMRRALLVLCLFQAAQGAPLWASEIVAAQYTDPTDRYAHGILGDAIEWGALELTLADGTQIVHRLPLTHVFEDTAPRLADLDLDGAPEVVVVETDMSLGARLAIYTTTGVHAATPYIGRTHRWLAPLGASDLDGDGTIELAYIDRPHLAKTLRIWRYEGGQLIPVADKSGLTNHRIGEADIAGGIRDCGQGPEIITADSGWSRLMASRLGDGKITTRDIGPHRGRASFDDALTCK